jgi:hypothetical protein
MFHKAKTEGERQRLFDKYFLSFFKKEKDFNRNQKIIDNSIMNFDPLNQNKTVKGVYINYIDSFVITNFFSRTI